MINASWIILVIAVEISVLTNYDKLYSQVKKIFYLFLL